MLRYRGISAFVPRAMHTSIMSVKSCSQNVTSVLPNKSSIMAFGGEPRYLKAEMLMRSQSEQPDEEDIEERSNNINCCICAQCAPIYAYTNRECTSCVENPQIKKLIGILCVTSGYPFDTIKTRQQNFATSLLVAVRETYKYEGVLGFYKGLLSPLIFYGPSNSIFFGIYGVTLRQIWRLEGGKIPSLKNEKRKYYLQQFYAGSIAGFFQACFMCPVELLKIVLQTSTEGNSPWVHNTNTIQYDNTVQALRSILKREGVPGLWKGLWPMLIRDVPTSGLYFVVYEYLLPEDRTKVSINHQLWAGGWAGIASISTVLPADVIKTRIQADDPIYPQYNGPLDCAKKLYIEEGWRIFWKGLPIITIRAFPAHAMLFIGYEATIAAFGYKRFT